MKRARLAVLLVLLAVPAAAPAQEQDTLPERPAPKAGCGPALNLGAGCAGLSIGNSHRWSGVRINFIDRRVERINGLNVTFWRSKHNKWAEVNGLSVGILPEGGWYRGVQVGVLGVIARQASTGLTASGLGTVAGTTAEGLNVGGLATVAGTRMTGVNVAGLATVAGTELEGVSVAGLASVAGTRMAGISVAGLAVVAGTEARGIVAAGLSVVAGTTLRGIGVAGLSTVGGTGIEGLGAAIAHVRGGEYIEGVAVSLWNRTDDLTGVAVGFANTVEYEQRGLTIGLFNYAEELHGVQLGVINIAANNRGIFKMLPLVNLHFD